MFWLVGFASIACSSVLFFAIYAFKKDESVHKLYLIWTLAFGIMFSFALPTYMVPDEAVHLYKTYSISNRILNIKNEPTLKMRADDLRAEQEGVVSSNRCARDEIRSHYNAFYKEFFYVFADDKELVDVGYLIIPYDSYMYVIPALGLSFARLLGLGTVSAYIMGSLFNLALFVVLTTIAIYVIPIGKEILFTLGLMPIVMQQVTSFSCDCFIISFSFIAIALSLLLLKKLGNENDDGITLLLVFWGVIMALLIPAKRALCAPLFLFSFILYNSAAEKNRLLLFHFLF